MMTMRTKTHFIVVEHLKKGQKYKKKQQQQQLGNEKTREWMKIIEKNPKKNYFSCL